MIEAECFEVHYCDLQCHVILVFLEVLNFTLWHMSVVPAIQAKAEGLLEPRSLRPSWPI